MSETYDVIESILQAMDIVSHKNLNGVAFDETIECEIVDNSDAKNGHYWVSDGSTRFEAYSEKNSYAKGAKVLVKIPCGDYSATKYIEGLAETEDGQPITYLSAINTIMDIVELTEKKPIEYTDPAKGIGLIANGAEKTKLIWSFDFTNAENANIWLEDIYTSFYIEADFKTNLNNVKNGTYGLYFEIGIRLANGNILTQYYNLNSTEFFGNPYRFAFFTNQSKKFNIKNFKKFETIRLFFSQGGDFKDKINNDYPIDVTENLFVNNIRVGLGTDLTEIPDNTVKLITLNSSGYGKENMIDGDIYSDQVQLDFLWYNKTEENKYLGFSDGIARIKMDNNEALQSLYSEYENKDKTCGLSRVSSDTSKATYNRLNTKNYDEELYIDLIQEDERLQQQKNENVPIDRISLEIMADVKDAHNALIKINDLINKDFKTALQTFKSNMPEDFHLVDSYDTLLNLDLEKHISGDLLGAENSINTEFSFLKYYENLFKYISTVQRSLREEPYDDIKDIKREIPVDFINLQTLLNQSVEDESGYDYQLNVFTVNDDGILSLQEKLDTFLIGVLILSFLSTDIKKDYSNYIKYYNAFLDKVNKILEKYLKYSQDIDKINNLTVKFKEVEANTNLLSFKQGDILIPFWEIKIEQLDDEIEYRYNKVYDYFYDEIEKTGAGYYYYEPNSPNNIEAWQKPDHSLFNNLYSIYWYRYEKDYEDLEDPFGEKDWKRITNGNLYQEYTKQSSENGDYLFIGDQLSAQSIVNLGLPSVNNEWIDNKKYWYTKAQEDDNVSLVVTLNPQKLEEKFKVVLIYNHEKYESNELIFTNLYHPNNQEVITDGVLEIKHYSNSQDHYAIYSAASMQLLNSNDSYVKRKIEASYKEDISSGHIYWYFPVASTQLELPDESELSSFTAKEKIQITNKVLLYIKDDGGKFIEKTELDGEIEKKCYGEPDKEVDYEILERETNDSIEYYKIEINEEQVWVKSTHGIRKTYDSLDGYVCFSKELKGDDDELKLSYRIKNNYNSNYTTNIIKCEIITSDGIRLSGNKGFTFSTFGSNGTDYTLIVSSADPLIPAFQGNDPENIFSLNVEVYNKNGEKENIETIEAEWINNITKYSFNIMGNNRIDISLDKDKLDKDKFIGLLKVSATIDSLPINLDTTYPVAWSSDRYRLSGPTIIPYNSQGVLMNYDKTPYEIYSISNNELVNDQTVEMIYVDNTLDALAEVKYMPKLKDGILVPSPLYVENVDIYPIVEIKNADGKLLFSQPILIQQNSFESSFLNGWDGTLQIDEEDNTIMSAMVGAGKKNDDNSFSGVLMGDVQGKSGLAESGIGLYGFHQGGQSFGFNVDGTAFLGKSGQGRIEFDGNYGIIKSALWDGEVNSFGEITTSGTQGMAISLESGHIDAYNFKLSSENITLNSNPADGSNWIDIGNNQTYLRFTNTGELDIRVTNFELTYHQGENLLVNTAPLENEGELLIYDNAWYTLNNPTFPLFQVFLSDKWNNTYKEYKKGQEFTLKDLYNIQKITSSSQPGVYEELYTKITEDNKENIENINDIRYKNSLDYRKTYLVGTLLSASDYNTIIKGGWKVRSLIGEFEDIKNTEDTSAADGEQKYLKQYFRPGKIFPGTYICKKACQIISPLNVNDNIIYASILNQYFEETSGYQIAEVTADNYASSKYYIRNEDDDSYSLDYSNDFNSSKVYYTGYEFICKKDIRIIDADCQPYNDYPFETNRKYYCANSVFLSNTDRKCICFNEFCTSLKQDLKQPLSGDKKNYSLSGSLYVFQKRMLMPHWSSITSDIYDNIYKIYDDNGEECSKEDSFYANEIIAEDGTITTEYKSNIICMIYYNTVNEDTITFKIGDSENEVKWTNHNTWIDFDLKFKDLSLSSENNIFEICKSDKYFVYFYHLKLEEGLTSTPWNQSTYEQNYSDKIKEDSVNQSNENLRELNQMLDSSAIFDRLTDNGKKQGFFTDPDTNNLFINAECVGTGLLRSNEVEGTFSYEVDDINYTGILLENYESTAASCKRRGKEFTVTDIQLSTGTVFDMRSGIIAAHKFELDAWDDSTGGLYLNSQPINSIESRKHYLKIGNPTNYIKFANDGSLDIQVTDFKFTYAFGENLLRNTTPFEQECDPIDNILPLRSWMILNANTGVTNEINKRKSIKLVKYNEENADIILGVDPNDLESEQYYTLSGEIYLYPNEETAAKEATFSFRIQGQSEFEDGINGNKKSSITFNEAGWHKLYLIFKTPPGPVPESNVHRIYWSGEKDTSILLHHLKLEKGRCATSWCQHSQEQNYADKIYDYAASLPENYFKNTLDQNAIFNKLTNNGEIKGIFMEEGNLYINANAIGTGLLRSNNLDGTFTYTSTETGEDGYGGGKIEVTASLEDYPDISQEGEFNLVRVDLKQGTLFNLNDGFFSSSNAMLNLRTSGLFFQEGYPYDAGDARLCLRYASKLASEDEVFEHLKKVKEEKKLDDGLPMWDGAKRDTIYHYYDINRDGKITAADARLILRHSTLLSTEAGLQLIFNNKGFQILKIEKKDEEEIFKNLFCIDQAGVYAKSFLVDNYRKTTDNPDYEELNDYIELSECLKELEDGLNGLKERVRTLELK